VESRGGRGGSELQYLAVSGWLALAENHAADAIRLFRESDRGACVRCVLPWLASAQDAAGAPDSALALYERYVNGVSDWPPTTDIFWLPSSLRRLGELYEARGNREKAVEYYARFAELWRNADPELQPTVQDVKQRIARLAAERN
jgi:tetratricopeptide (TPR) repeat protein